MGAFKWNKISEMIYHSLISTQVFYFFLCSALFYSYLNASVQGRASADTLHFSIINFICTLDETTQ